MFNRIVDDSSPNSPQILPIIPVAYVAFSIFWLYNLIFRYCYLVSLSLLSW